MAIPDLILNAHLNFDSSQIAREAAKAERLVNRIKLNPKSFALGRITGDVNQFTRSLEAASARISAFGATFVIFAGLAKGISSLVRETINLEKKLTDINVILNLSSRELSKFGGDLTKIAKDTANSFDTVAIAATEFSRQGLGVQETLKRTRDALILTRLSGLDAASSVKALTAAINTFSSEALDSTQIINKLAKVDAAFAVSANDLAAAITRLGNVAGEVGVPFDKMLGIITAVQQRTARGGEVISNAIRTIFVRIQRPEVLDQLESLGVHVRELSGEFVSADRVLAQLASKFDGLSDAQKSYTTELVAGNRQVNTLQALLRDLASANSVVEAATRKSSQATSEAIDRNDLLNRTLDAQVNKTTEIFKRLAAQVGGLSAKPLIERVLGDTSGFGEGLSKLLEVDAEGIGANIAKGIFKGIGSALAGPGLLLGGTILTKLLGQVGGFGIKAAGNLLSGNNSDRVANVQGAIAAKLAEQKAIGNDILAQNLTQEQRLSKILSLERAATAEKARQVAIEKELAILAVRRGVSASDTGNVKFGNPSIRNRIRGAFADGLLPAIAAEEEQVSAGVGGAARNARAVVKHINMSSGRTPVVVNTSEKIVRDYMGSGQDAVFNPQMISKAGGNLGRFGRVENISKGHIPNFTAKRDIVGKALRTGQFGIDNNRLNVDLLSSAEYGGNPLFALKKVIEEGKIREINTGPIVGPRVPRMLAMAMKKYKGSGIRIMGSYNPERLKITAGNSWERFTERDHTLLEKSLQELNVLPHRNSTAMYGTRIFDTVLSNGFVPNFNARAIPATKFFDLNKLTVPTKEGYLPLKAARNKRDPMTAATMFALFRGYDKDAGFLKKGHFNRLSAEYVKAALQQGVLGQSAATGLLPGVNPYLEALKRAQQKTGIANFQSNTDRIKLQIAQHDEFFKLTGSRKMDDTHSRGLRDAFKGIYGTYAKGSVPNFSSFQRGISRDELRNLIKSRAQNKPHSTNNPLRAGTHVFTSDDDNFHLSPISQAQSYANRRMEAVSKRGYVIGGVDPSITKGMLTVPSIDLKTVKSLFSVYNTGGFKNRVGKRMDFGKFADRYSRMYGNASGGYIPNFVPNILNQIGSTVYRLQQSGRSTTEINEILSTKFGARTGNNKLVRSFYDNTPRVVQRRALSGILGGRSPVDLFDPYVGTDRKDYIREILKANNISVQQVHKLVYPDSHSKGYEDNLDIVSKKIQDFKTTRPTRDIVRTIAQNLGVTKKISNDYLRYLHSDFDSQSQSSRGGQYSFIKSVLGELGVSPTERGAISLTQSKNIIGQLGQQGFKVNASPRTLVRDFIEREGREDRLTTFQEKFESIKGKLDKVKGLGSFRKLIDLKTIDPYSLDYISRGVKALKDHISLPSNRELQRRLPDIVGEIFSNIPGARNLINTKEGIRQSTSALSQFVPQRTAMRLLAKRSNLLKPYKDITQPEDDIVTRFLTKKFQIRRGSYGLSTNVPVGKHTLNVEVGESGSIAFNDAATGSHSTMTGEGGFKTMKSLSKPLASMLYLISRKNPDSKFYFSGASNPPSKTANRVGRERPNLRDLLYNRTLRNLKVDVQDNAFKLPTDFGIKQILGLSKGLIPNFSPLNDAIGREVGALKSIGFSGIQAQNAIKIGQSPALAGGANPLGLGVYNTLQESSLNQGIGFARQRGENPKNAGIPNFAQGFGGISLTHVRKLAKLSVNDPYGIETARSLAEDLQSKGLVLNINPKDSKQRIFSKVVTAINNLESGKSQVAKFQARQAKTAQIKAGTTPVREDLLNRNAIAPAPGFTGNLPLAVPNIQPPVGALGGLSSQQQRQLSRAQTVNKSTPPKLIQRTTDLVNPEDILPKEELSRIRKLRAQEKFNQLLDSATSKLQKGESITRKEASAFRYNANQIEKQNTLLKEQQTIREKINDLSIKSGSGVFKGRRAFRDLQGLANKLTDPTLKNEAQASLLGARQQRQSALQGRGLQAAFALPFLTETLVSAANVKGQTGRAIGGVAQGLGTGAVATSLLGFTPGGIAAGAGIGGIIALKAAVDSLVPSFEELVEKSQSLIAENEKQISAAQNVIQAQSQLQDVISSPNSTAAQRRLASQNVVTAFGGISDLNFRSSLIGQTPDEQSNRILDFSKEASKVAAREQSKLFATQIDEKSSIGISNRALTAFKGGKLESALNLLSPVGFLSSLGGGRKAGVTGNITDFIQSRRAKKNVFASEQGQIDLSKLTNELSSAELKVSDLTTAWGEQNGIIGKSLEVLRENLKVRLEEIDVVNKLTEADTKRLEITGNLAKETTRASQIAAAQSQRQINRRAGENELTLLGAKGLFDINKNRLTQKGQINASEKISKLQLSAEVESKIGNLLVNFQENAVKTFGTEAPNIGNPGAVAKTLITQLKDGGFNGPDVIKAINQLIGVSQDSGGKLSTELKDLKQALVSQLVSVGDELEIGNKRIALETSLAKQALTRQQKVGFFGGIKSLTNPSEIAQIVQQAISGKSAQINQGLDQNTFRDRERQAKRLKELERTNKPEAARNILERENRERLAGFGAERLSGFEALRELFPFLEKANPKFTKDLIGIQSGNLGNKVQGFAQSSLDLLKGTPFAKDKPQSLARINEVFNRTSGQGFGATISEIQQILNANRGSRREEQDTRAALQPILDTLKTLAPFAGKAGAGKRNEISGEQVTQVTLEDVNKQLADLVGLAQNKGLKVDKFDGLFTEAQNTVARLDTSNTLLEKIAALAEAANVSGDITKTRKKESDATLEKNNLDRLIKDSPFSLRNIQGTAKNVENRKFGEAEKSLINKVAKILETNRVVSSNPNINKVIGAFANSKNEGEVTGSILKNFGIDEGANIAEDLGLFAISDATQRLQTLDTEIANFANEINNLNNKLTPITDKLQGLNAAEKSQLTKEQFVNQNRDFRSGERNSFVDINKIIPKSERSSVERTYSKTEAEIVRKRKTGTLAETENKELMTLLASIKTVLEKEKTEAQNTVDGNLNVNFQLNVVGELNVSTPDSLDASVKTIEGQIADIKRKLTDELKVVFTPRQLSEQTKATGLTL